MSDQNEKLAPMRHSLCHLMSMAIEEIYPNAGLGVGPAIDDGFYQDYDLPESISEEIFSKLEKRMREMIAEKIAFVPHQVDFETALKFYSHDPYKTEMIVDLRSKGEKDVCFYKSGWFDNLCKGSHVANTSEIDPEGFKLTRIAGAYWRGDEKNKMLTRIYGVAFASKAELDDYLARQEEAMKRDHRKLGRELDLFSLHEEAPGMIFWHPKGMAIWNELEKFGKSLRKRYGGLEIQTPQMAKNGLWITSGHWDHYQKDMFVFDVEKETYCLKPMDCPFNILIYKSKQHSYRELPVRFTELGRVFRNEKSGELNGLFRVRGITQDDSHIFLRPDQVEVEISSQLKMVKEYYSVFGINPEFYLSTRPEDFMGEIATWDIAEKDLSEALSKENITYGIKDKDGAFYGPKIDVNIKDVFGRTWQVATIQLDFQLAGRFELEYIDENAQKQTPVMIHAAIFGSFERFIGVLIEHYGGVWPTWLAPVQIQLIPVNDGHHDFCRKLADKLSTENFRVEIDTAAETVGNKIRKAEKSKVPYMLVVGDKEMQSTKLQVRLRGQKDTREMSEEEFCARVKQEIVNRREED